MSGLYLGRASHPSIRALATARDSPHPAALEPRPPPAPAPPGPRRASSARDSAGVRNNGRVARNGWPDALAGGTETVVVTGAIEDVEGVIVNPILSLSIFATEPASWAALETSECFPAEVKVSEPAPRSADEGAPRAFLP